MVRLIVSGTPAATPDAEPKLDRMSFLTTPLWARTSGPFDPSPGKGPAVSSGIGSQLALEPVVTVDPGVLPAVPAAVDAELRSAPGVQPKIVKTPAATPAVPMSLMTCRRSIRVVRSNASPWSKIDSFGSSSSRSAGSALVSDDRPFGSMVGALRRCSHIVTGRTVAGNPFELVTAGRTGPEGRNLARTCA